MSLVTRAKTKPTNFVGLGKAARVVAKVGAVAVVVLGKE